MFELLWDVIREKIEEEIRELLELGIAKFVELGIVDGVRKVRFEIDHIEYIIWKNGKEGTKFWFNPR